MISTHYRIFGIDMHRQASRRKLITGVYAIFAILIMLSIAYEPFFGYNLVTFTTLIFFNGVFGFQGRGGLLKPFTNKPPRTENPNIELVRLNLAPETSLHGTDLSWRNDERELSRRNLAHYKAYQIVSFAPLLIVVLSAWTIHPVRFISPPAVLRIIYTIAQIGTVLALTLPAAIILWTEPDLDTA